MTLVPVYNTKIHDGAPDLLPFGALQITINPIQLIHLSCLVQWARDNGRLGADECEHLFR